MQTGESYLIDGEICVNLGLSFHDDEVTLVRRPDGTTKYVPAIEDEYPVASVAYADMQARAQAAEAQAARYRAALEDALSVLRATIGYMLYTVPPQFRDKVRDREWLKPRVEEAVQKIGEVLND